MARSWIIGSSPECDLMVDRPMVSGRHCRLAQDDAGLTLEDLGSSNGTFVNGTRLDAGATVRVGRRDAVTLGPSAPLPWPPELASPQARVLRIGREADNDIVLNSPMVSGRHARLVWEGAPAEVIIEDLGSSNGLALGSPERKVRRAAVSASDTVFFGTHAVAATQLLWQLDPSLVPTLSFHGRPVVIGRNVGCDQVFNQPMVSGRHARLVRSEGQTWIEDLGSSNGTFVNGQRVERTPVVIRRGDLISFGTFLVVFDGEPQVAPRSTQTATLLVTTPPGPISQPTPPPPLPPSPVREEAADVSPAAAWPDEFSRQCAAVLRHPWRLAALLAQSLLVALLIVLVLRVGPEGPALTPQGWNAPARTLAGVLFWLGLASVWFGLSNAVFGVSSREPSVRSDRASTASARVAARLVVLGALGVLECVLAWAAVAQGAGLKGPGLPMLALLVMASAVGLALGLAVVALSPRPEFAWAALPVALVALWLFGGEFQPLPRMVAWARPIAGLAPSRWAFEGLLLLESERHPWRVTQGAAGAEADSAQGWNEDFAEAYFPAESERMGVGADTTALAAMLLGLAALAAFVATVPAPSRGGRPVPGLRG